VFISRQQKFKSLTVQNISKTFGPLGMTRGRRPLKGVIGKEKQQVPPLRFAPVGMTILLCRRERPLQMKCHPDGSEAKWRDLLFIIRIIES
jgi:hypothetical protein